MNSDSPIDKPVAPEWQWWDHLRRTGDFLEPLHDGVVHFGYYRRPSESKKVGARWVPFAIWGRPDGTVVCEVDGQKTTKRTPFQLLFSKYLQGISRETYMAVTRKGEPWPDAPPPLEELAPEGPNPDPQPPTQQGDKYVVRIGNDGARTVSVPASDREVSREDNIPADAPDDHRILIDQQATLAQEANLVRQRLLLPIQSQDEANAASEHANRIDALGKWFGDEYERRNRPLLDQQKRLRMDYLHPAQEAAGYAKALAQHMAGFLLAEQRKLEAEQRAAAEAEAARIQKAAEEAAAKGEVITPEIVRPGAPTPPRRAGAGGLTGRRTTVSEENVGSVTNYMEFAAVLIRGNMANPPPTYCSNMELKTVLDEIARKLARTLPADQKISGLQITKQAKARR